MLGRFETVARRRPVDLVQPGTTLPGAPYAAVEGDLDSPRRAAHVALRSGSTALAAVFDGRRVLLEVTERGRTRRHQSRRHAGTSAPQALGLTLTGPLLTAFTRDEGGWTARGVVDLAVSTGIDPHDEAWLAGLEAEGDRAGTFGQLGLRDLRLVTEADGSPYTDRSSGTSTSTDVLLTATSAGPGGFRSGHTSVWSLDPTTFSLSHRADLFLRRPGRPGVYGDHAAHLLHDAGTWRLAASTWGDFDRRHHHPHVSTTIATTTADLTRGTHVLDAVDLILPTADLASVGTWDPHLVRTDDGWLAAFVSATSFFRFHPVIASGPDLHRLSLRAAASDRVATEGVTLLRPDTASDWVLAASDGRDGRRRHPPGYPLFDLDLRPIGRLDAHYPSNLSWPTVVPVAGERLLVGFDGTRQGGPLLGYGTHGDVVVQRAAAASTPG